MRFNPRNLMSMVATFEERYGRRAPLKAKRLQVRFALHDEAHATLIASGVLNDRTTHQPSIDAKQSLQTSGQISQART